MCKCLKSLERGGEKSSLDLRDMDSDKERRKSDKQITTDLPLRIGSPENKIVFSRRWFLKIAPAAALGVVTVVFFLKDKLYRALVRQVIPDKQSGGVLSLEEFELTELATFAAALGGLSSKDHDFTVYAKPIIQQAAQELKGIGIALRKTAGYLNEVAEVRFHTLDGGKQEEIMGMVLQEPSRPMLLHFRKWIKYRTVKIAEGLLLRIVLNSPQSWARLGYRNYPGVFGDLGDYQYPPEVSSQ